MPRKVKKQRPLGRLSKADLEAKGELLCRRHQPVPAQGAWLGSVVRGYFACHAVPANSP